MQLVEARIRLEDVDAEHAAGVVVEIAQQADAARTRVEAGLAPSAPSDALRVDKDLAARTAAAVDTLRAALAEWNGFYDGYDPVFTWWMGMPFAKADAALESDAALLRGKVVSAALASNVPVPAAEPVVPAPPPAFASVPDLDEMLALPQDEMTRHRRALRRASAPRRGRGVTPRRADEAAAAPRDRAFYEGWLKALEDD